MPASPVMRPFAEPLYMAALELDDLVRLGDKLELMVTRLSALGGDTDPVLLAEGQAADLLTQRLAGVAAFVRALADAAPAEAVADVHGAVMGLTLAEQARRLSGPVASLADEALDDDVLLFGD